mmetsp:Transcript_53028/g.94640  ORF Transcript_53028/g.94640 Transcript_53028/m.94640 type:complete len:338 (-) Transcript_53028:80-1093(-)
MVDQEVGSFWKNQSRIDSPPKFFLTGRTDFTFAPIEAATKVFMDGMLRSPTTKDVTRQSLKEEGFEKYWAPVERLLGCLEWGEDKLFLLNSTPWDGACEGRLGTILKNTDFANKKRVRDFFARPDPLGPLVGECKAKRVFYANIPLSDNHKLALISRYRDNIYICLANIEDEELDLVRLCLSTFLNCVYGIPLKWEPHEGGAVWGEACISHTPAPSTDGLADTRGGISVVRKGCVKHLDGEGPKEWDSWVSSVSPNGATVWSSQFIAILHKCLWYAVTVNDIQFNLRSLMWGVGCKHYPWRWWYGSLKRFHRKFLSSIFPLKTLLTWHSEGNLTCMG